MPYGPPGSTDWSLAAERAGDERISMRLRTLRVGGALHGPVAHGLACGALLCVNNGSLWNAMAWHGTGYDEERRTGRMAARSYRSWQDFSAGYILGRCLHFDEEEYGEWYTSMVDAHRILVSDPHSPWVNIPFR
ncbi:hypothetical protein OQI_00255 [Streptomyces pharetrae CZA14]|uniref:DUF1266 domain-containing protein n=1 Tax=Streptomyces pharetrae CZA14 TaxID=1144883 RepID=A0ABX3YTN7_9ACTN|nr:hypothetical protein OQI_00255 [Streptomyces pharetrae CZA14]